MEQFDVIVLGAGAAGMMCAIEAGRRGRRAVVLDHAASAGEKIRISGGGRCNFTNIRTAPEHFLSENPRFAVSALKRFSADDFISRVREHGIAFHEKALGQLFCDGSSNDIIVMLLREMAAAGVTLRLETAPRAVAFDGEQYDVATPIGTLSATSLVVATGGKSIPKMGATGFAYDLAEQFGLRVVTPRPGLVPLTFQGDLKDQLASLTGISVEAVVRHGKTAFREALLFTHRGLSGPAILQISSFWREGDDISVALAPDVDVFAVLKAAKSSGGGRQQPATQLAHLLPKRLADNVVARAGLSGNLADLPDRALRQLDDAVNAWQVTPAGSEGWRTAEVTVGGVATDALDQRTMAVRALPHGEGLGLYFIGEAVDVTGWLGGYNFQWAWSSGWAAGQVA